MCYCVRQRRRKTHSRPALSTAWNNDGAPTARTVRGIPANGFALTPGANPIASHCAGHRRSGVSSKLGRRIDPVRGTTSITYWYSGERALMRAVPLTLLLFLPWLVCAARRRTARVRELHVSAARMCGDGGNLVAPAAPRWAAADGAQLAATVQASPAAKLVWWLAHAGAAVILTKCGSRRGNTMPSVQGGAPTQSHSTTSGQPADY